jgi:hypothetical protein
MVLLGRLNFAIHLNEYDSTASVGDGRRRNRVSATTQDAISNNIKKVMAHGTDPALL